MLNTVVSKGIHPAGIVASPITLPDNYGIFHDANGLTVLNIDMEEVHESGLVKYDILGLKNIGIIDDCCKLANVSYPLSHEINWNDKNVWNDMITSPVGIFQFEGSYAFDNLKKFKPQNINDMSLVNAALRPSGASYRDDLLARKPHRNPSEIIDNLLKPNYGYLCIEENQKVRTVDSVKPIKDIKPGDMVYTTNGLNKVNKVFQNGEKETVRIQTKYSSLQCTAEHEILTQDGWKRCKDLTTDDYVAHYVENSQYDNNLHWTKIISIKKDNIANVYDLEINNTHNYIAEDIVVHNCYQEDVIAFLQQICGLSGGDADNVRRAIGRKQVDRLEKALPQILEGYCNKSTQPREIAEREAKEFLQIIEDASSYMFGYNHSTGYSMIGYLCAYYRYYYPLEFICSYLNNAKTQDDIIMGAELAKSKGIKILSPKFRYSLGQYFIDKKNNAIYKGIASVKFLNENCAIELYNRKDKVYNNFIELLVDLEENSTVTSRQIEILIQLDFFEEFGKAGKLLNLYHEFSSGQFKYQKTYCAKTKEKRLAELLALEVEDIELPIKQQIAVQTEYYGSPTLVKPALRGYAYILNVENKYSPKVTLYGLGNGKITTVKISSKIFKANELHEKDIIGDCKFSQKKKRKKVGEEWIETDELEWWLESYRVQQIGF